MPLGQDTSLRQPRCSSARRGEDTTGVVALPSTTSCARTGPEGESDEMVEVAQTERLV